MEPGKGPDENEPLSFLIPLGPEDDSPPDASAGYTPAPVRHAPSSGGGDPPKVGPPFEPMVLLDPLGSPSTQPPPMLFGKPPAANAPLPDPAGLIAPMGMGSPGGQPFSPAQPASPVGGPPLAEFFLGSRHAEEKPFQAPPTGPAAGPPPAPFEAPKIDGVANMHFKPSVTAPLPSAEQGSFQIPQPDAPLGGFKPLLSPPPGPLAALGGGPPPAQSAPALPALSAEPPKAAAPPRAASRDASSFPRPPHTAPPIRLPGKDPAPARPLASLAAAPVPVKLPQAAAASDAPLGLIEFFECSGKLAFATRAVLERCRAAPAPSPAVLMGHALCWMLISFVVRTGLVLGKPATGLGLITGGNLALSLALGLAASSIGVLAAAGFAHGLGRLSGGLGGYIRGLQVVSLLAPLAAVSAILSPVQALWWLPGALGAYLLARTLAGLYSAPIVQVGVMVGTLAFMGGMAQYKGRQALARWRDAGPAQILSDATQDAQARGALTSEQAAVLEQLQTQVGQASSLLAPTGEGSALGLLSEHEGDGGPKPQAGNAFSATGAPLGVPQQPEAGQSLMPLLPVLGVPLTEAQKQNLKAQGGAAIQQVQKMFSDPKMTEGMSAEQRRQFQQLQQASQAVFRAGQGGKPPTPAETQQLMKQMQQMMQTATQGLEEAPQAPPQRAKRRRRAPRPPADE